MDIREETLKRLRKISPTAKINLSNNVVSDKPASYLFHHIPKCGGMDFYGSISPCVEYRSKALKEASLVGRQDNIDSARPQAEKFQEPLSRLADKVLIFFASHSGKSVFDILFGNAPTSEKRNISFLRDPYRRALSAYCYACMRSDSKPTVEEFESYIQQPEQINVIARSLYPEYAKEQDVIDYVEGFYIFSTLENQDKYLTKILVNHGLPNVVREVQNQTLSTYRLDDAIDNEVLQRKFKENNALDYQLFEIATGDVGEDDVSHANMVSKATMLISSKQTSEKHYAKNLCLKTDDLVNTLLKTSATNSVEDFFTKYGRA